MGDLVGGNDVRIWIHRPIQPVVKRQDQSALARLLLRNACNGVGLDLPGGFNKLPALELFDMLERKLGLWASIAHCRELIIIALSGSRVGIDCEIGKLGRDWQGIADLFFTMDEAGYLRSLPESKAETLFLRYWTMKEAFAKATRSDFWKDRNNLSFIRSQSGSIEIMPVTGQWKFWHRIVGDVTISACSEGVDDQYFHVSCFNDQLDKISYSTQ